MGFEAAEFTDLNLLHIIALFFPSFIFRLNGYSDH